MQLSQLCDSQLSAVEERVKVLVSEHQPQELATRKEIELEIINVESTRD
jgi:exonuclease VII small subunit